MRGKLGPILAGVGGFLLVLGIMLNVYAYPRLAVAPLDQESISTVEGPDATLFDIDSLSEIETDTVTTANTVGDVDAAKKHGDGVAVWVNTTSTKSADGVVRSRSIERVAFDQHTGEAVDCCGAYSESKQGSTDAIKFEGQVFKFPFRTEKQDYQWWDGTLRKAFPAKYEREEDFKGIKTYVFKQVIEPTVWTQMEVPPSVVGEVGKEALNVDRTYGNVRTFWVEPETGVVINRVEEQQAHLQFEGENRTIVTEVTASFSDETVAQNVADYKDKPAQLRLVRVTLPLVLGVLGLLLVAGGFLAARRNQDPKA